MSLCKRGYSHISSTHHGYSRRLGYSDSRLDAHGSTDNSSHFGPVCVVNCWHTLLYINTYSDFDPHANTHVYEHEYAYPNPDPNRHIDAHPYQYANAYARVSCV